MPITVIGQETFGPVTLGDISARGGHWWKPPNAGCRSAFSDRRRSTGQLGYRPSNACHCAIEPLRGSACATITANATPAAVSTQLMVLARYRVSTPCSKERRCDPLHSGKPAGAFLVFFRTP